MQRKRTQSRIHKEWMRNNQSDEFLEIAEIKAETFQRYLEQLLAHLPERTRQAVTGHLNKIPAKDTARMMGIRLSTYHTLKDRGIKMVIERAKETRLPMWFMLLVVLFFHEN